MSSKSISFLKYGRVYELFACAEHLRDHTEQLVVFACRGNSLFVVKLLVDLVFRLVSTFLDQNSNPESRRKRALEANADT